MSTAIAAESRTAFGRKAAEALRRSGRVPLSISRHGEASLHLSIAVRDAEKVAERKSQVVELAIDGQPEQVLVKNVAIHPVADHIQQIDTLAVTADRVVVVDVAVIAKADDCPGLKAGGLLERMGRKVRLRCRAADIPANLIADLSNLELTQTYYAGDLPLPEGAVLATPPKTAVMTILKTRGLKRAEGAEATEEAAATAG